MRGLANPLPLPATQLGSSFQKVGAPKGCLDGIQKDVRLRLGPEVSGRTPEAHARSHPPKHQEQGTRTLLHASTACSCNQVSSRCWSENPEALRSRST